MRGGEGARVRFKVPLPAFLRKFLDMITRDLGHCATPMMSQLVKDFIYDVNKPADINCTELGMLVNSATESNGARVFSSNMAYGTFITAMLKAQGSGFYGRLEFITQGAPYPEEVTTDSLHELCIWWTRLRPATA